MFAEEAPKAVERLSKVGLSVRSKQFYGAYDAHKWHKHLEIKQPPYGHLFHDLR